jgi:hypothetical protein
MGTGISQHCRQKRCLRFQVNHDSDTAAFQGAVFQTFSEKSVN